MKYRPQPNEFVRNRKNGLKAQVYRYFSDKDDVVEVIVLPQPGFSLDMGSQRYQRWGLSEIEPCSQ